MHIYVAKQHSSQSLGSTLDLHVSSLVSEEYSAHNVCVCVRVRACVSTRAHMLWSCHLGSVIVSGE